MTAFQYSEIIGEIIWFIFSKTCAGVCLAFGFYLFMGVVT